MNDKTDLNAPCPCFVQINHHNGETEILGHFANLGEAKDFVIAAAFSTGHQLDRFFIKATKH